MSRLLFVKEGAAIWSSHLDLMRALMRSFRRAGIDLKHSQGFTPHPELSILMPLSVGVESECEIADFTLAEGCAIPAEEIAPRLAPVLPAGIRALESWDGGLKAGKLAWLRARLTLTYQATGNGQQATGDGRCAHACRDGSQPSASPRSDEASGIRDQASEDGGYAHACRDGSQPSASPRSDEGERILRFAQNDRIEALQQLFARPSIVVEKHGKKGTVETDIAPMLREVTVVPAICRPDEADASEMQNAKCKTQNEFEACSGIVIEAVVAAQNPTLNPLLLAAAIETYLPEYKPDLVQCRRLEIYDQDMNVFR